MTKFAELQDPPAPPTSACTATGGNITMSLSYEEALATLKSMFGDQGYTAQDLDAVLRHFGGHMENTGRYSAENLPLLLIWIRDALRDDPTNSAPCPSTVEALLSHGGPPSELIRKLSTLPVGGGSANSAAGEHTVDTDAELARRLAAEDQRRNARRPDVYGGREHGTQQSGFALATGRSNYQNTRRSQRNTGDAPQNRNSPPRRPHPPAGTKGIGTPTTLPKDFLRIPERTPDRTLDSASSTGQLMTDEQLARSKLPSAVSSRSYRG